MVKKKQSDETNPSYQLHDQVGYILRRASQRHLSIFGSRIETLTSTQFAALAKLFELGEVSQNELGRQTAMDGATIKGVIDRLRKRELVASRRDSSDGRRIFVRLSTTGREVYEENVASAIDITEETLAPLSAAEQRTFLKLLGKLG